MVRLLNKRLGKDMKKKIRIKAGFLMEKDKHLCILKEKDSDFIKEFSFLIYESDIADNDNWRI